VTAKGLDYPSAERLQPNLVWLAKHLERHKETETTLELLAKLDEISKSTLQRTMRRVVLRM
jgi:hypothetical protein